MLSSQGTDADGDLETTELSFGIIIKLMVLRANGAEPKILHVTFVKILLLYMKILLL